MLRSERMHPNGSTTSVAQSSMPTHRLSLRPSYRWRRKPSHSWECFLNEPHSTHRYYGEILESNRDRLFLEQHSPFPYYAAGLALSRAEDFFRAKELPVQLRPSSITCYCFPAGAWTPANTRR